MAREAEFLIIGGGIAGTATAFYLARQGRDVALVERGEIASEASGVNAGQIGATGWGKLPDLDAYLTMGSLQLFKELQLELKYDIEFRQSGSLTAIHSPEQYDYMRDRVLDMRSHGFEVELLTAREARAIEPEINPALPAYMHTPLRAQADPVKATRAFADAATMSGARILTNHAVSGIATRAGGGYSVETDRVDFVCESLVMAAGAWCGPVGRMLGLEIPITPVRGQMWSTDTLPPSVFQTMSSAESAHTWSKDDGSDANTPPELTHRGDRRVTRHLYGRQRRNGEIIFGGDRQMTGYDKTVEHTGIEVNKGHASEVLPMLSSLPIARTWSGLMPFSIDGAPIIGSIPNRENLYIVSGLASSGFGRGPMASKLLADFIHTGHRPQVLVEADPARCVTDI
ncbi:MAG: FAD-dependent oxidoreductase [Dehalococcoidia bacterium]|nr:FAD-dependent oxidoreductase [Dehalococcoidia bacterium]